MKENHLPSSLESFSLGKSNTGGACSSFSSTVSALSSLSAPCSTALFEEGASSVL